MFIYLLIIEFLTGPALATTADIGMPWTYHKNYALVEQGQKYTQFAIRWDYSQDVDINKVALFRWDSAGTAGPYDIKIVNDNDGVPGSTVYAQNLSWSEIYNSGTRWYYSWIPLNSTFTLPANTKCWVVIDGRDVTSGNGISWEAHDLEIISDGAYGIDYAKYPTKGWNGTAWVDGTSPSNIPIYGCLAMMNNDTILGDGQFAFEERTYSVYGNRVDGETITNAPTVPYKINDVKARMYAEGDYGTVYFVVLDKNGVEIANRTVTPSVTGYGLWSTKQDPIIFDPAIEIGAGNSTITCIFKCDNPLGANGASRNITNTRGIIFTRESVSYPYGVRYATGDTGTLWNSSDDRAMDLMMNMSISFGDENSTNDYFVSSLIGNNSYDGTNSWKPWKTLSYASTHLPANSTLWLMPGTYVNDTLTLTQSNVNVSAFSTGVNISMVAGQTNVIYGNSASNVTVNGINIKGAGSEDNTNACCIFFQYGNNITVSNCTITDGNDGIRFRRGNDTLAQGNYISRMRNHGVHLYGQMEPAGKYSRMSVIRNNISDCGHNMIDLHSNISDCKIANNDVYFTDDWIGNKNNVGIFLHNGNIPNTIVENNTVHHLGRPLELNNANDCIIRNNNFYDGLTWGSGSSSRILIEAVNGTVPCDPFGCRNITFSGNIFSGLGYVYTFYHEGTINASFTNFTLRNNTYNNVGIANLRKQTSKPTTNIIFKDEKFTNFTIIWNGNTIHTGDVKFENTSSHSIYSDSTNNYSICKNIVTLDIDNNTTDIWYGDIVPAPFEPILPVASFSSNVTSGNAPLNILFTDTSTGMPVKWNWNFGDGTVNSTIQNPAHTYEAAGIYTVTLTVTDANNNTDSDTCTVTVLEKQVATKVRIFSPNVSLPGKAFTVGLLIDPSTPISGTQLDFVFDSSMASANSVTEGDLLKQSGAYTIFSGGTINNSAGTVKHIYGFILGTANVSTPGTMATVNLTAGNKTGIAEFSLSNVLISDSNSKSVPHTVTNATVLIDTAPVMNAICCPKSVDEKSTLTFKINAKDADGDRLVLSASGLPQGAVFNTTSGNFTWTPSTGQAGVYTITFKVSDGYLTDSQSVTITVKKPNNPPVINSFEPLNGSSFSEGERIKILVNASDANGQALDYSIRIDGVVYTTDKEYVWETDYSSSGNHTIEVVVSDGIDEVKKQHIISITNCHPRWDVNEDGVVNILDITNVSQKYEITVSKPYPRYDVNQDGEINILDLTLVGHHFGELVT